MHQKLRFCLSFIVVASLLSFYSCSNDQSKELATGAGPDTASTAAVVERGEHLVEIMGCNDCHSPKQMGPQGPELIADKLLSGYPADRPIVQFDSKLIKEGFAMFYPDLTAAAGPWGISFAGNLTPDDTGIGNWTEPQFKKALKEGKLKGMDGARTLLPPMPWANYKSLTDEEVHAIFMYLKSIKPVKNLVPQPIGPDQM